jgi:ATP-binding protein involved in chromosome partitioning
MALDLAKRKPRDIIFADDLTVEWKDGTVCHYAFLPLRDACPCAACVDEISGAKILDPKKIPADIFIRRCEYVGNYAIRITWSDGHDSGIFSFRFLRELHDLNPGALSADPAIRPSSP